MINSNEKLDETPIRIDNFNVAEVPKYIKEKSSNLLPHLSLKRAISKKFDFLSLDSEFFEKETCVCCRKKSIQGKILYENANNYLSEFLDIETLFINYQEVDMLKKILFDLDQRKLFEFLARLSNLPNIFSVYDKNEKVNLIDNNQNSEIFRILERIIERGNKNDLMIIKFIKNLFNN